MKQLKQTFEFIFEVMLFVSSGFFVALGLSFGYFLLILGFIMAFITGRQIQIDAIEKYKESLNGHK